MTKPRKKFTFAGKEYSFIDRGYDEHYTVPINALKSILESGKVRAVCTGKYTDDYAYDAERKFCRGEVPVSEVLNYVTDRTFAKPSNLYFDAKRKLIRYCPMQSLGFNITEIPDLDKINAEFDKAAIEDRHLRNRQVPSLRRRNPLHAPNMELLGLNRRPEPDSFES